MLTHPLVLAIALLDGVTLLLMGFAVVTGIQMLTSWAPNASTASQLRLERRYEGAGLAVRSVWILAILSSLTYISMIASIFPGFVPGAMCGTGVMQAMGAAGTRSILLRLVMLFALHLVTVGFKLDTALKTGVLSQVNAKSILVAGPLLLLGAMDTWEAMMSLNTVVPVSCCSALLETVQETNHGLLKPLSDRMLTVGTILTGLFLAFFSVVGWFKSPVSTKTMTRLVVVSTIFLYFGSKGEIRVFSAYHFEVLNHHCPWCLLLMAHRFVGYPIFGALLVVGFETGAVFYAHRLGRMNSLLRAEATRRMRNGFARMIGALALFALMTLGPALEWYLRYGVWMNGS